MIILLIGGILLTGLSSSVLFFIVRVAVSSRRELRRHGVDGPIPITRAMTLVGGGWTVGLIVGLWLIILSQR